MTELFEKSIRVLELPQLLERLSQKAVSEAAKERALRLTPSTDADDVRRLQDETDAARALIGNERVKYLLRQGQRIRDQRQCKR